MIIKRNELHNVVTLNTLSYVRKKKVNTALLCNIDKTDYCYQNNGSIQKWEAIIVNCNAVYCYA